MTLESFPLPSSESVIFDLRALLDVVGVHQKVRPKQGPFYYRDYLSQIDQLEDPRDRLVLTFDPLRKLWKCRLSPAWLSKHITLSLNKMEWLLTRLPPSPALKELKALCLKKLQSLQMKLSSCLGHHQHSMPTTEEGDSASPQKSHHSGSLSSKKKSKESNFMLLDLPEKMKTEMLIQHMLAGEECTVTPWLVQKFEFQTSDMRNPPNFFDIVEAEQKAVWGRLTGLKKDRDKPVSVIRKSPRTASEKQYTFDMKKMTQTSPSLARDVRVILNVPGAFQKHHTPKGRPYFSLPLERSNQFEDPRDELVRGR